MQRTVILINGKGGSGKDTIAKMLLREISKNTKESCGILHNADAVKDLAKDFFNWSGYKDDKGRKLLIDITNSGYNYDPNFWEKKTLDHIVNHNMLVTIIPDWRYMSTYDLFKEANFNVLTMHLNRVKLSSKLSKELQQDKSEQKFENFSYDFNVVNNSDSIKDMDNLITNIFTPQLLKRMELK